MDPVLVAAVARAICGCESGNPDQEQMTKEGLVPRWTLFRPHARAAIAALDQVRGIDATLPQA